MSTRQSVKSNWTTSHISPEDYNFELPETGDRFLLDLVIKLELMIPETQNIQ